MSNTSTLRQHTVSEEGRASLEIASTLYPRVASNWSVWPPMKPDAPVTRTVFMAEDPRTSHPVLTELDTGSASEFPKSDHPNVFQSMILGNNRCPFDRTFPCYRLAPENHGRS